MSGTYQTIVADPPWRYDYPGGPGDTTPWRSGRAAQYATMPLDEIKALGDTVRDFAAPGAHLYLWAVLPMMREAYQVLDAWGFRGVSLVTWCKPGPGLGKGWRSSSENMIVARDKKRSPFRSVSSGTWFDAPRGAHSEKPELFMDLIETMSPGPYLEMFSRRARLGWDTWGNESLHGGAA